MAFIRSHQLPPRPAPATLAPLVQEHYHVSSGLALALAAGALSRTIDALALARQYKLIDIETAEARQKGLLQ